MGKMIFEHPTFRPHPSIFWRLFVRTYRISIFHRLHQLIIIYHSWLHVRPPSRTQFKWSSPDLFISEHATFPYSLLFSIFIFVHPLLDPLSWESRVPLRIIVYDIRMDTAKHQHVKTAMSGSPGRINCDDVLKLMMIDHKPMRRTVRFVVALVNTSSTFLAVIQPASIVQLKGQCQLEGTDLDIISKEIDEMEGSDSLYILQMNYFVS
jgi:hypothetical protein